MSQFKMMSQFNIETIVCPQCNHRDHLRLWKEIYFDKDITAKNRLLEGTLFKYKCKKCGYAAAIAYNCIYKNTDRNFMIYFAADGDVEGMRDAMDKVELDANKIAVNGIKYNVRRRIVISANAMREKIIILESGLDDRIIELMKLFYISMIKKNNPDMEIIECLFYIVNDAWRLELATIDGKSFAIDVQKDIYDELEKEYRDTIDKLGDTYFIDTNYAMNVYFEER